MYQGADGQWYDDNGEPTPTAATGGSPASAPAGMMQKGNNPDGTPRYVPSMPGYDPEHNPYAGSWQFDDPNSSWFWLPDIGQGRPAGYAGEPLPSSAAPVPDPAPGPEQWQGLQQSVFGDMPAVGSYPAFEYAPWNAPEPFSYDPWSQPTAEQVATEDPGFQFRVGQGRQAMEQSAAARGVLNTGGTLQDLINYGQAAGSQEFGNAVNRSRGAYETNRGNAFDNYAMNYNNKLNSYITNFGNALTGYNSRYQTQYLMPWQQLQQQYGQRVNDQGQLFNQQYQTATA